jgi:Xaa-Pro aminopeptidase
MSSHPEPAYRQRLSALQKTLANKSAALLSKPNDIYYFTGFPQLAPAEREAFLLLTTKSATLFHHSFSPTLPKRSWLTTVPKTDLSIIGARLNEMRIISLLVDEDNLSVNEYFRLKNNLTSEIKPLNQQSVWTLRARKDATELKLMQQAGRIGVQVINQIRKELKADQTEQEIANRIVSLMLEQGARGQAFPTIVAFGPHGALPHHQVTATKLKPETPVLIDLGVNYEGYLSDLTRTFWFGKQPTKRFLQIEQIVQTAYQKALERLKNRTVHPTAQDLDAAARRYITDQGFGEQFIHTTGHGLGLEIHEPPSLSWQNEVEVLPGNTLTIEPGIYLDKEFGYRYENTVAVTKSSTIILTKL